MDKTDFKRIVLAHKDQAQGASRRIPFTNGETAYELLEYDIELSTPEGPDAMLPAAEQIARDKTFCPGQLRASERLYFIPPETIASERPAKGKPDAVSCRREACRPREHDNLFVLGPCADLTSAEAHELMRPPVSEVLGREVGQAAHNVGVEKEPYSSLACGNSQETTSSEAQKCLTGGVRGHRTNPARTCVREEEPPCWARFDIVVVGGGTSGACAAIGALRQGRSVLVIEYQEGLGGTGTLGLIGKPHHGEHRGFTCEVPFMDETFKPEDKMEWFRQQIRSLGGDIWLNMLAYGVNDQSGSVTGVLVASESGHGLVQAHTVIDATGNADIAAAAGAQCVYGGDPYDVAMQGAGLPPRHVESYHENTDYLFVDDSDMVNLRYSLAGARQTKEEEVFDVGSLVQTRERRRIVGEHTLKYVDQIAGRTYADSIVYSGSDYDSHGYPSSLYFAALPHDEQSWQKIRPGPGGTCYTPYRCLLPRGIENLLVTGLGISMHRDAAAMVRMQPDLHNQGYAAGVAAAMASAQNINVRNIDVRELQKHLVHIGNLPAEALEHTDSFPLPLKHVQKAVRDFAEASGYQQSHRPLAIIMAHPETAVPQLRRMFDDMPAKDRLGVAKLLGLRGEKQAVPALVQALERISEWDAKIYQGRMAEYAYLPTPVDGLILALGQTQDERALPALLNKLQMLDQHITLSHHRSVALALENLGMSDAARPLAELLDKPGMSGHVMINWEPLYDSPVESRRRTPCLREITLARALYHCGDHQQRGRQILEEYRDDVRGLFARHASNVLNGSEG